MATKLKNLVIKELSLVDVPANPHAKVTIFKAAKPTKKEEDDATDRLSEEDDEKSTKDNVKIPANDRAASTKKDQLNRQAVDSKGNGKSLSKSGDSQEGDKMPDEMKKQLDDATATIEKLKADNARFEAISKLNDADKAYMSKLDENATNEFIAKSADERTQIVKAATASDETITVSGTEIRKSIVGDAMFAVIKSQQAELKTNADKLAKSEEIARKAKFEKRASDEFMHVPGEDSEIASVLDYMSNASEDVQKTFNQIMKSAESTIAAAFTSRGHSNGQVDPDSKAGQLTKLAKAYAAENNVSLAVAEASVLEQRPDLYEG